jgi:hypothetical protein
MAIGVGCFIGGTIVGAINIKIRHKIKYKGTSLLLISRFNCTLVFKFLYCLYTAYIRWGIRGCDRMVVGYIYCDMRFINLTCKIAQWTCSSVRGSNNPSKPIRIKIIHSHLIIIFIILIK